MTTRTAGRHRAPVRPRTPFTDLSEAVAASMRTVGRRTAVIAASSGLVVTMGLPVASAAPTDAQPEADQVEPAEPAPAPRPTVTVPADAQVSFAGTAITSVTAPPPPPPPPPPPAAQQARQDRTERASRSTDRAAAPAPSSAGGSILSIAARYAGIMYVYGGTTPAGFDCSGYTQYVYRQAGISLPRTSGAQAAGGRRVSASEAQPGDLVWNGNGHIGIYAGGNMMWDSPRTGKAVQKRSIWFSPIFISYR